MENLNRNVIIENTNTQIQKDIDTMLSKISFDHSIKELEKKAIHYLKNQDNINLSFDSPHGKRIVHIGLGLTNNSLKSIDLLKDYLESKDRVQRPNYNEKAFNEIGKDTGILSAEFYKATTLVGTELAKEYSKVLKVFSESEFLKNISEKIYTNTHNHKNTNAYYNNDINTQIQNTTDMNAQNNSKTLVYGKLIDSGVAAYKDDSKNEQSFFVEVEKRNGEKTKIWGVELQGALEASGKTPGDQIKIDHIGKVNVQIPKHIKDENGNITGLKMISAERNSFEISEHINTQNHKNTNTQIQNNSISQNDQLVAVNKSNNTSTLKDLSLKDIAEGSILLNHKQDSISTLLNIITNTNSNKDSMLVYGGLVYPYLGYDLSFIKKEPTNSTTSVNNLFTQNKVDIPTVVLDAIGQNIIPKKLDFEEFSKLAMGEVLSFPVSGVKYAFDLSSQKLYSNLIPSEKNNKLEVSNDSIKNIDKKSLEQNISNVDGEFTFFNKNINKGSIVKEDSLTNNIPDFILNKPINDNQKLDLINFKSIEIKNASIGGLEVATVKLEPIDKGNGLSKLNYRVGDENREIKASDVRMNIEKLDQTKKESLINDFNILESKLKGMGDNLLNSSSSLSVLKNYEVLSEKIKVIDYKLPEVNKTTPDLIINNLPDYANTKNYKIEKENKIELIVRGSTNINDISLSIVEGNKIGIFKENKQIDTIRLSSDNFDNKTIKNNISAGRDITLDSTTKPYLLDEKFKEIGLNLKSKNAPGLAERSVIPSIIGGYKMSKSEKNELIKNSKVELSNKTNLSIISVNGKSLLYHNNEKGSTMITDTEKSNKLVKNNLVEKLETKKSFGIKL